MKVKVKANPLVIKGHCAECIHESVCENLKAIIDHFSFVEVTFECKDYSK